ncbi:hypothetical protein glysoja_037052, partial [Glycine soja]
FSSQDDYNTSLYEGPWMVEDHYLVVQRWYPFFPMNAKALKNIVVWIRIQCLPIELYNNVFLQRIGSSLGKFLKVDKLTSVQSRGKFTKICVELDLEKPLVPHIYVRGYKLNLEYKGLHSICFRCGCFGHKKGQLYGGSNGG